ncbi:MAG: putative Ig domain-containing protein, partial [Myxococcales bacterium]|nr:putative Ig domain-containing protein [Myxococcales bacterium]
ATQTFSIEVVGATSAPAIVSTPVTAARAGQAYSYTVVATGVPTPTLTATLNGGGALPAWLTFDPATGVLSGTPAATDVGNYDVIITASNGVNPDAMQAFTITVGGPAGIPVLGNPYLQTFTGGLPADWVATGQWAVGAPTTGAASVGPPSVFDGDLAATNLTGNYTSSAHWNLDTPAFDFTGVASPQLRFVHWHNFERATSGTPPNNYDGGNIKISTDNGTTWVELDPASVTPAYQGVLVSGNSMPGQQAWSGILTDWTRVSIDLTTALTGQPLDQVKFRFDFGSDSSVTRPGWYVDNVRVGDAAQIPSSPVITSVPPAQLSIVAGELFTYVVTATGNPTPQLTATSTSGALPAWLTFDPATGVLTGTPANADAGLESIVITATNGQTPDAVQQFTLDVLPIEALATYIFDGDVRTPDVVATDVTAGELNNRAGTTTFVTGNPGRALNSNGFNVAVDPNYYEFVITPAAGFQVALDAFAFDHYRSSTGPTSFQVLIVSGGVTSTVTAGAGTMPTATTWTTATIPLAGAERGPFTGPVAVRITASGASSATGTFRIDNVSLAGVVQPRPNSAPVILSSPATVAQIGTPYSYPIVVDGWPAPTVTVSGLPTWLTYNSTTRTISGNPSVLSVGTSGTITVTAANTITPNATQTFTVTVAAPAAVPVIDGSPMTQNFSATLPTGWGATGGWEFGIPTVGANTVGPPTVYDGEVAATRIAANYTNSSFWSMATEIYDLSAVTNPTLQFVHWYNFERSASGTNYDGANIKISTDGGASWVELLPASVTPAYTGALGSGTTGMAGQQGWSGILTDWQIVTVDLSANLTGLRDQVAIRFDMGSDSSTTRPGWYVDDVRIGALADLVIAPTVTSAPRLSGMEGAAYSYSVTATGLPAPTLAATGAAGAALPAWLTFNPATGILSGTPGATDVGDHAVDVTATNAGGVDTQSFSIHVFAAGTLPVFTDGFEGPANPWTIGFDVGTASDWEIGTATVAGPLGCFAGAQCAGTILDGDYSVGPALSYMQTPVVNLTGIPQPAMRFMQWYRTESGYDGGNVKISTDGGLTFSPLTPSSVTPAYTGTLSPAPMAGQLAWTGVGTTWTAVTIDLSADLQGLPRDQIVLRFDFASDTSLVYTGWYLDDVQVGDYATLQ